MNLQQLKDEWEDTPAFHTTIHEYFSQETNADEVLKSQRAFFRDRAWGMGEDSFPYLWKILLAELPEDAKLLEIGVHKSQILSLWRILKPNAEIYGITPLDGRGTGWIEDDYAGDIKMVHEYFHIKMPNLIIGASQDEKCIVEALQDYPYDVIYIDGSHEYEDALADFNNYAPMVKLGGYLVVDDCNNDLNFPPTGFFCGIDSVTEAKKEWLKTQTDFAFVASCVHISIFHRIK